MLFLKVLNQVSYSLITLFMVFSCNVNYGLPSSTVGNNQPVMQETRVPPVPGLGRFPREGNGNPLEYSFWEIPWTEEAAGLQSMRLPKSWTLLSTHTHTHAHYQWLEKRQVVPAPEKGCYGNHVGFEDLSQKGSSTLYIFTLNKKLACTFILKDVVWPYKPGTGSERCRMFKCSFFYC